MGSEMCIRDSDGKLHGIYSSWSSNGEIQKQRTYNNDQLHGPSVIWWANDSKILNDDQKIADLNGPFGSPNQNHLKKEEANYLDGMLDGIYNSWLASAIWKKRSIINLENCMVLTFFGG